MLVRMLYYHGGFIRSTNDQLRKGLGLWPSCADRCSNRHLTILGSLADRATNAQGVPRPHQDAEPS